MSCDPVILLGFFSPFILYIVQSVCFLNSLTQYWQCASLRSLWHSWKVLSSPSSRQCGSPCTPGCGSQVYSPCIREAQYDRVHWVLRDVADIKQQCLLFIFLVSQLCQHSLVYKWSRASSEIPVCPQSAASKVSVSFRRCLPCKYNWRIHDQPGSSSSCRFYQQRPYSPSTYAHPAYTLCIDINFVVDGIHIADVFFYYYFFISHLFEFECSRLNLLQCCSHWASG